MGIGPSTKETTLHRFRDPILEVAAIDGDVNVVGIIISPTPQSNKEKMFTACRAAAAIQAMGADGAVVSVDGFGNSHIDFANILEETGRLGIPSVGMSFVGEQGKFVTTNEYMDTVVDLNKSEEGVETQRVGENTADSTDAKKAIALLKLKIRRHEQK